MRWPREERTWSIHLLVAVVCTVTVAIPLAMERILHYLGKILKWKQQRALYEALLKIKEDLMLLGFVSLLLTVLQGPINSICISQKLANKCLTCKKEDNATAHFQNSFSFISARFCRLWDFCCR